MWPNIILSVIVALLGSAVIITVMFRHFLRAPIRGTSVSRCYASLSSRGERSGADETDYERWVQEIQSLEGGTMRVLLETVPVSY